MAERGRGGRGGQALRPAPLDLCLARSKEGGDSGLHRHSEGAQLCIHLPLVDQPSHGSGAETSLQTLLRGLAKGREGGGSAQDEGVVPLVSVGVDECGRLRVRAADEDCGHAQDVALETGGHQSVDVLPTRHQHLAGLVETNKGQGQRCPLTLRRGHRHRRRR